MLPKFLSVTSLLITLGCATAGHARSANPVVDGQATVLPGADYLRIEGPMGRESLQHADRLLAAKPDGAVNIVINSPGGAVYAGMQLVQAMDQARARGVVLRCFVLRMAASMAFQVLAHCDERYALAGSLVLWHPVRAVIGGGFFGAPTPFTPADAAKLARDLARLEQWLRGDLIQRTPWDAATDDWFMGHYLDETLHPVASLAGTPLGDWITVLEDIQVPGPGVQGGEDGDRDQRWLPGPTPQSPWDLDYSTRAARQAYRRWQLDGGTQ